MVLGKNLPRPLVVKVTRLNDSAPVVGINVTFNIVDVINPSEVMWISRAIWMDTRARIEPAEVTTGPDGTAQTYLWLAGSADVNTIIADVPLCLNHVIFTAVGEPSSVWSILTYVFLFVLVGGVVILNVWYQRTVTKRKIRRFDSSTSLSNQAALEEETLDPLGSPPMSPSLSPSLSHKSVNGHSDSRNADRNNNNDNSEEEDFDSNNDDDPFQAARPRKWQNLQRKLNWQLLHMSKRVQNFLYGSK